MALVLMLVASLFACSSNVGSAPANSGEPESTQGAGAETDRSQPEQLDIIESGYTISEQ
jgi:hypothetical protein